ncbi:nucleoside triphosphate pyrophosphohydrolase [candidate division WOR-1 bacterium RIFOXYA12_FULL_52_29]|uniref:Nucleoside triphosphate pyrophosphohydrolase n=1 Tax=candidate division WOR-1 bacterium RIFOXYC12_FULL_54_18 TaxID=1802584 RepID=A0A1F4T689_UNCSA|nr:MAG: nucleoside triphosphate pyrophosphohydrolase [candidate division WOR-1 bacterium RIFOXYA2_FULL_51_19]OGC17811.1 MAG: nucleoside triphosphate pyrophosphohydrolase [candidate division WOR-1 bacterium RIFOXYA12_FULL_52_29]OGC26668.1 MAG: nucleoside triphosphate pyrophosphohydrolase [candidate division WOR-1 bacterium RIFOXYB2_FULL_45_9]OGC28228.1 MAG: nucleoside triphosphate pyrophosphohydrolase [candidate division WOR-1 bacterium RIFOXYC12_FULL_54_18]OGC29484.1 MAG: nucleoside triphosphat
MNKTGQSFEELVKVVAILRKKCPWDREQTFASLKPFLIEEVYEAIEAIDHKDFDHLCEELGDMLLHIVMLSVFASQKRKFDINQVVKVITEKMIRRHPHVFGKAKAKNKEEVWRRWEKIKREEKRSTVYGTGKGMLDSIPKSLPALSRADKIQKKAARVGFDWDDVAGAWEKVDEERAEIAELLRKSGKAVSDKQKSRKKMIREEIGDLLFSVVNVARKLEIDPEDALQQANKKFIRRFSGIEDDLSARQMTVSEMDSLWKQVKASEKMV